MSMNQTQPFPVVGGNAEQRLRQLEDRVNRHLVDLSIHLNAGDHEGYEYDATTGLVNQWTVYGDTGKTIKVYEETYNYDSSSLLASMQIKIYKAGELYKTINVTYTYDAAGKVTGIDYTEY